MSPTHPGLSGTFPFQLEHPGFEIRGLLSLALISRCREATAPASRGPYSRHSTAGQGRPACPLHGRRLGRGGSEGRPRALPAKDARPSTRSRRAPRAGHLRAPPRPRSPTPGSHRAEVALPPRPPPGCGSPSDLQARGWKRGEGQSRHIPVRPAAGPAAASIASTA